MKIEARIDIPYGTNGPDPWDDKLGIKLPLDRVICRDANGTPHLVGEFVWPWTAYTALQENLLLHFFYWKQDTKKVTTGQAGITAEREARIREVQFLMTRQIYYGAENAPSTLRRKLSILHRIARFAESRSCAVRSVLTKAELLDACGETIPDYDLDQWISWLAFLRKLDPETQLGFRLATPNRWKHVEARYAKYLGNSQQFAPLPTRIYAELINNLSAELDDIEAHKPKLLAALRDAIAAHREAKAKNTKSTISIGKKIIEKHNLNDFLSKRGLLHIRALKGLSRAISEIFQVCKLQIHVFSGMRATEARQLPYHCMVIEKSLHGRKHCLIAGATTKFNKGRRLRTKWITTENDGFRAIRLAQEFATVIYDSLDVKPSKADNFKDNFPLFPSTEGFPWGANRTSQERKITASETLKRGNVTSVQFRVCPLITDDDLAELENIDPFRAWREEPEFTIGNHWPLSPHQLRRSLAVYANASGLVRLSSLRRQLQHLTREMALYYGRGSTFCKNFVEVDPSGYKKHVAVDWQDGAEEAEMLAFVRDVLNSTEPMFGGAGTFYERQRERGDVMSREEVARQMKAGLLAYREGPLGGCTRPGTCETRKGLNLIDTVCATDGCKNLIGKHSKIVQTIRLKRAAMTHITPGSITEAMEREELEALEGVERNWRPQQSSEVPTNGGKNA